MIKNELLELFRSDSAELGPIKTTEVLMFVIIGACVGGTISGATAMRIFPNKPETIKEEKENE